MAPRVSLSLALVALACLAGCASPKRPAPGTSAFAGITSEVWADVYRHNEIDRVIFQRVQSKLAVEPQYINGHMHSDGATIRNVFLPSFHSSLAPLMKNGLVVELFILMNGRLNVPDQVTEPRLVSVAARAVDVSLQANSQQSLLAMRGQILADAARYGFDPAQVQSQFAFIPDDYPEPSSEETFDTEYMNALVEFGRRFGREGRWTRSLTGKAHLIE